MIRGTDSFHDSIRPSDHGHPVIEGLGSRWSHLAHTAGFVRKQCGRYEDRFPMQMHNRFLIWIDAVGGYWVCLDDEIILGQPVASDRVDVPLLGDLSGRHARIRRDGEGYLIEAIREVSVDGRRVVDFAPLVDGNLIQLGPRVKLLFRKPHALSATARLDFASLHRTQPSADAIVLMADTCVLGPKPNHHIVCRRWSDEVVLFRHDGNLFCRASGNLEIDGNAYINKGPINRNSRISGERFSLCLEQI